MKLEEWEAEQPKDPGYVEALNKLRGKRVQIEYCFDIDNPKLFVHKYHSKKGKFVLITFGFIVFYLGIEIRYHKKGTTPWLRNNA